jgi:hypothetical protein
MPTTSYCTAGQTARVTIGGQIVAETPNTPITVECLETLPIRIAFNVTFYNSIGGVVTSSQTTDRWGPFLGWQIGNNGRSLEFLCRTGQFQPIPVDYSIYGRA